MWGRKLSTICCQEVVNDLEIIESLKHFCQREDQLWQKIVACPDFVYFSASIGLEEETAYWYETPRYRFLLWPAHHDERVQHYNPRHSVYSWNVRLGSEPLHFQNPISHDLLVWEGDRRHPRQVAVIVEQELRLAVPALFSYPVHLDNACDSSGLLRSRHRKLRLSEARSCNSACRLLQWYSWTMDNHTFSTLIRRSCKTQQSSDMSYDCIPPLIRP